MASPETIAFGTVAMGLLANVEQEIRDAADASGVVTPDQAWATTAIAACRMIVTNKASIGAATDFTLIAIYSLVETLSRRPDAASIRTELMDIVDAIKDFLKGENN